MKKILIAFCSMAFLLYACSESFVEETIDPTPPENPFDSIDWSEVNPPELPVDSNTFVGLHTYIFSSRCNQPACHDGTFEPDFRTVQGAYNSLVEHSITKNYDPQVDGKNPLSFRVAPGSLEESMMWQRLTNHEPPNFERMPSSGNPLPDNLLTLIRNWIEDGAKDPFGIDPMQSNEQPNCFGVLAYVPFPGIPGLQYRTDTIRVDGNPFNSFVVLANEEADVWFGFLDFLDEVNYNFGENLTNTKIQLSTNLFDFSDAVEVDLEYVGSPKKSTDMFSLPAFQLPEIMNQLYEPVIGQNNPYHYKATFNASSLGFATNSIVYMRIIVQDEDHEETAIPEDSSIQPFAFYYSFFVYQP
ncbi:hypothetical protein OAF63_00930 [Saprospiraceae bacterium]|jgi:hypothetical protein|nr:hypothetical protein [Bacteroidota bacterium]MDB4727327.1 hypothetical protein [Saprospiraceae bacterium]MDF1867390.1 hypothetical protein [Saprospiraceae bacterium]